MEALRAAAQQHTPGRLVMLPPCLVRGHERLARLMLLRVQRTVPADQQVVREIAPQQKVLAAVESMPSVHRPAHHACNGALQT
jgi:hypothetical protein